MEKPMINRGVRVIVIAIFFTLLLPINNSYGTEVCASLNQSVVADDGLTVTVSSMSILEKSGSIQLSVSYRLQNQSKDKKIDEGYFEVQYSDGTREWKGSRYFAMFPNDFFERTYTWEYLKTVTPSVVAYRSRDDLGPRTSLGLHWPVLNETCASLEAIRMAKAKAEAEAKAKAEAEAKAKAEAEAKAKAEAEASKKRVTIKCTKGKVVRKVTAVNPKCPKGYTKK